MTAFAAVVAALFRDPNMAKEGLWRSGGVFDAVPVRVIMRAPDADVSWGEARARMPAVLMNLRISEVPDLAAGDTIEVEDVTYRVQGAPRRDAHRLMWAAEAVEVRP